jgi:peroxiredoxin
VIKKLKLFIPGIQLPNMNNKMKIPSGYMKPYRLVPPPPKALNKSWTQEEIQDVLNQVKNKRNPEDIAKKLNRPVSEVRSRLKIIAADMYLNDKLPYEKIQEQTGVEKDTLILTSSTLKHDGLNESTDTDDNEQVTVDISIYNFPEDTEEAVNTPDKQINVDIKDNQDEMIITVSVDSPFSVKSLCEHLSTPIISTFTTCSRFAKKLSGVQYETTFLTNQSQH